MSDKDRDSIYTEFNEAVNMAPKDLEEWLDTDASNSVGDADDRESTGHRMGRRIVTIKRTSKADLTDSDLDAMQKVVGYVHRHLAQGPQHNIEDSDWRYSLMNWGHDPLED